MLCRRWTDGGRVRNGMITVKNKSEIIAMREACRRAADVRDAVAAQVMPGVTTAELAACAEVRMRELGCVSAFLNYRGFPGLICVSVNDEVVHGIPGQRRIKLGDVVSLDVGVRYEGFVGDTATTVLVGVEDMLTIRQVQVAREALTFGIAEAKTGNRVGDISHAIERTVTGAGFSVVRQFVGHGIGRALHEDPEVPNFGSPGRGPLLKAGMTLAIEPMVNQGVGDVDVMKDGWTVCTHDRLPSVHVEHTVLVGVDGGQVLTQGV